MRLLTLICLMSASVVASGKSNMIQYGVERNPVKMFAGTYECDGAVDIVLEAVENVKNPFILAKVDQTEIFEEIATKRLRSGGISFIIRSAGKIISFEWGQIILSDLEDKKLGTCKRM